MEPPSASPHLLVEKLVFNHGYNHSLQDMDIVAQPDTIKITLQGCLEAERWLNR